MIGFKLENNPATCLFVKDIMDNVICLSYALREVAHYEYDAWENYRMTYNNENFGMSVIN